eukprot:TRINITY_DN76566_c0_g1_i1.p1 TRINITY_DN76566_c0_g1~~TRINITY_DN76566_c0_g1_i1.p1  ORF type:complete len:348 (-),score=27.65 TRINITY_DN76566_c0_g1_i1:105-1148(-)
MEKSDEKNTFVSKWQWVPTAAVGSYTAYDVNKAIQASAKLQSFVNDVTGISKDCPNLTEQMAGVIEEHLNWGTVDDGRLASFLDNKDQLVAELVELAHKGSICEVKKAVFTSVEKKICSNVTWACGVAAIAAAASIAQWVQLWKHLQDSPTLQRNPRLFNAIDEKIKDAEAAEQRLKNFAPPWQPAHLARLQLRVSRFRDAVTEAINLIGSLEVQINGKVQSVRTVLGMVATNTVQHGLTTVASGIKAYHEWDVLSQLATASDSVVGGFTKALLLAPSLLGLVATVASGCSWLTCHRELEQLQETLHQLDKRNKHAQELKRTTDGLLAALEDLADTEVPRKKAKLSA